MKNKGLTKNIPLKIMSVLVAILVWLIVVNVDNPVKTRSFTISGENVEVINKAYVDSDNKMVMQDSDPESIRVTITGERKTISRISTADITLTADLQQAVSLDTTPVMVPIVATCPGITSENIKVVPQYMEITLQEKASQEFLVTAAYGDTKPAKGYEVGTQTVSPEKVKITGPKSLINKIDKVNAYVSVDGLSEDSTQEVSLQIVDKNQDVLTEGRMAYLTIDNSKVTVTTKLWKIRSDVNISANYTGEPADGYQVESVTTVPDTISLAGTEEALEELKNNKNTILISGEGIDISDATGDVETKVSLEDVIPENTKLTSGSSTEVLVTVAIVPKGSHIYSIQANEVDVENLADGLQYAFDTDKIEVRVKAAEDEADIEEFDPADIKAAVDLTDMAEGSYEVPVTVTLPDGYELLEDVTANITISKISTVTAEEVQG